MQEQKHLLPPSENLENSDKINEKFVKEIEEYGKKSFKLNKRFAIFLFVIIVFGILFLAALAGIPQYKEMLASEEVLKYLLNINTNMLKTSLFLTWKTNLIMGITTIISIPLFLIPLHYITYKVINKWLKILLLNKPFFRKKYLEHDFNYYQKRFKNFILYIYIGGAFLILSVIYLTMTHYRNKYTDGLLSSVQIQNYIVPILMMFVALLLIVEIIIYRKFLFNNNLSKEVYNRIQLISLITNLFGFISVIIAFTLYLPAIMNFNYNYARNNIEPELKSKKQAYISKIKSMDDVSEENKEKSITLVKQNYDRLDISELKPYTFNSMKPNIRYILQISILTIILTIVSKILIHHFLYNGIRKGLIFISILFLSMLLEFIIENKTEIWFFTSTNYLIRNIIILSISFSLTFLFDWIYGVLTYSKIECLNCEELIDNKSNYCPNCGLIKQYEYE